MSEMGIGKGDEKEKGGVERQEKDYGSEKRKIQRETR